MSYFRPEPSYKHGDTPKIGIIISNLGTPESPTPKALRKYLGQFLMDRRVVEIPRFIWWLILHFIILIFRPSASAKKYKQIWTNKGSPLMVNAKEQTRLLRNLIQKKYLEPIEVELAMSYGQPSFDKAYDKLRSKNCTKILLFPLYPQYAASSTASSMDSLWRILLKSRNVPEIRTIRNYHDQLPYITALKKSVQDFWAKNGKPNKLVISFHGVPKKSLMQGDPYHCECLKTGRLLAESLKLKKDEYQICFQSRFGKAEWLKPYFTDVIRALGQEQKNKKIHVVCPGFSSDCLETLEEINIEGKNIFMEHGGQEYNYIPALNANPEWINAMSEIIDTNIQGWIDQKWSIAEQKKDSNKTKQEYNRVKKIKL